MFRQTQDLPFQRERFITPDDDFLDIDFLKNGHHRIALLCHGLEGSSDSHYIRGTADILHKNGWDVAAMNYRGCSGEINKQIRMYHSGATDDLEFVFNNIVSHYEEIALVGFSLGGNMVLKYAGEKANEISQKLSSIVAISVPTNLEAGSLHIGKKSNFLYTKKFLSSLVPKMKLKHQQFPEAYDLDKLKGIKTIYDFDDVFTGPIHGFQDAHDYYTKSSSAQFIPLIRVNTLIINALDDPFLPKECFPYKEVSQNSSVQIMDPKYGGHVGFVQKGRKHYWNEIKCEEFLNIHSKLEP